MLTKTHIEAFVHSQAYRDALDEATKRCLDLGIPWSNVKFLCTWCLHNHFSKATQSHIVDDMVNAVIDRAVAEVHQRLDVADIRNSAFQLRWARALRLHQAWIDAGLVNGDKR